MESMIPLLSIKPISVSPWASLDQMSPRTQQTWFCSTMTFLRLWLGVKKEERMFDNLKKSLCYTITIKHSWTYSFLRFHLCQIPLPLSTILMLAICVGTDMIPAISFSYEEGEIDIMTRNPRDKEAHWSLQSWCASPMLSKDKFKLMQEWSPTSWSCTTLASMPRSCSEYISKDYYPHNPSDIFNPTHPFLGNTNARLNMFQGSIRLEIIDVSGDQPFLDPTDPAQGVMLDWLYGVHSSQDVRMGFLAIRPDGGVGQNLVYSPCRVYQVNPITHRPVCYTTDAVKYAQTGYFVAQVLSQFFNSICCKTSKNSFLDIGLKNTVMIFGWTAEFFLCIDLLLLPAIANGLQYQRLDSATLLDSSHNSMPLRVVLWWVQKMVDTSLPKGQPQVPQLVWEKRPCTK